jgi:hypothetical protein
MSTLTICNALIERGEGLIAEPFKAVKFTGTPEADALLNDLAGYAHAFVIACLILLCQFNLGQN